MKKTDNEINLTKREKKKIKDQIYDEIKDDLTVEISKSILDEVKKSMDSGYKDELKNKITYEITDDIKTNIRKEEHKLSRGKDLKIFRLYIYIFLLLALFGFVVYKLYITNHLNVIVPENIKIPTIKVEEETTTKVKESEDLIKKYSYLMDNVILSDSSLLTGQNKMKDIDITERLKLAYNALKKDQISIEGSIYMISSDDLKESYNKLFSLNDYKETNFSVNSLDYKYSSKTNSYIAISNSKVDSDEYILEVENIFEDDSYVYIEVISALKKNDYIYNINNTESSIAKYKSGLKLNKYKAELSMNRVVFEKETNTLYAILKI